MKAVGVILVAGNSTRFENDVSKQLFLLAGKPVFAHSLEAFYKSSCIDEVCIVTNKDNILEIEKYVKINKLTKVKVIVGGKTRQESVENSLKYYENLSDDDVIIIHDGARPLIDGETIDAILSAVNKYGAVTTAIPMEDTVSFIKSNSIASFADRSQMARIQTPQAFKFGILKKAHINAKNLNATDDCSLVMALPHEVKLIPGSKKLSKITTIEDIKYLETFIK